MLEKLPKYAKVLFLILFVFLLLFIVLSISISLFSFPLPAKEIKSYLLGNNSSKDESIPQEGGNTSETGGLSSFGRLSADYKDEDIDLYYRDYFKTQWNVSDEFFNFEESFLVYPNGESKRVYGIELIGTLTGYDLSGDTIYVNTEKGDLGVLLSTETNFLRLNPKCGDIVNLCFELLESSEDLLLPVTYEYFISVYKEISELRILFSSIPSDDSLLESSRVIFLQGEILK